ncbi:hypothetical protein LTR86_003185 [Recurvomyces mirabilis]|nr:hypothetical protein LTR86_003185 [Recurvomyces mirabilis]
MFHEDDLSELPLAQADLMVRITIAKVLDLERVQQALQNLRPRSSGKGVYGQESCAQWTRNAIKALLSDPACVRSVLDIEDWDKVEKTARDYCKYKRRDGRFSDTAEGNWNKDERDDSMSSIGCYDLG